LQNQNLRKRNGINFGNKIYNMEYFLIGILGTTLWLAYEMWRAPLLEMDENGNWITKQPTKKLKDLFKKK
jgi:hypothetical protein